MSATGSTRPSARGGSTGVAVVAALYVASWVGGLTVASGEPSATDSVGTIRRYYAEHGAAVLTQSLLVHGLAGLCLLALAWSLPGLAPRRPLDAGAGPRQQALARRARVAGTAAAAVSLAQVGFAVAAVRHAADPAGADTGWWLDAINRADILKLCLLAVFVATASRLLASRWLRAVAVVLVPMLPLGGAAFVVTTGPVARALGLVLALSLLALLLWAGSLAVIVPAVGRQRARGRVRRLTV